VLASMERPMHEILREALAPDEAMRWG
jgi:hypothetical protein